MVPIAQGQSAGRELSFTEGMMTAQPHPVRNPSTPGSTIDGWRIDVGDEAPERVAAAIRNRQIGQGALTEEFEHRLATTLHVADVVCTTSGTTALLMAFLAAGVGPGSEVIVPDRTWVATAHAALLLGAKVRLVDVSSHTPLMDPEKIFAQITPRTRVVVPVHLNGRAVTMDPLQNLAKDHNLDIIEDACQALFSKSQGQYLGSYGRFGCFSLGLAKVLTTGQGGFIACRDKEDGQKLRRIRNQGLGGAQLTEVTQSLGGNFKFTDLQAALGLSQWSFLPHRLEHQRRLSQTYADGLQDIPWLQWVAVHMDRGEIPLRAEFVCSRRAHFIKAMQERGISVTAMTPSLHEYPHLQAEGSFPNADRYGPTLLTLPSGPEQPLENVAATIREIKKLAESSSVFQ